MNYTSFEICSIRPPTENQSLTFRLTRNCYWNKCTFCPVYKLGARFVKRSMQDIKDDIDAVRGAFPSIHRFTVYGRTATAARVRSLNEMREFCLAGLNRVHYGVESGSDTVLKQVCKGETKDDHMTGCLKTREAGLSCSIYVMPGLGGQRYSEEHARETADVISRSAPDFVRLRTLQVFPHTPLARQLEKGSFEEAGEEQVVREIRQMITLIDSPTQIISDSATNLLQVNGRLPEDRLAMLNTIDAYLALAPEQKKMFSLQARLESFQGQYGGFSEDIYAKLVPFVKNGSMDIEAIPEFEIDELISMIRAKLMP